MKRILTPLFLLVLTNTGFAQHYSCFVPGAQQYFVNNYGYLKGMRIDSIVPGGNDIWMYHPFRTPRGSGGTLDHKGGSWLGRHVMKELDGTFSFFTTWGDTVVLKTEAPVGQSWIFLNDSSNRQYVAEVASIDWLNVAGSMDSVKRIVITAWEDNAPNPADSFHGAEILLSKYHGFVQVFDLYMFPYHPYNSTGITNDFYFRRSYLEPFDNLPGYAPPTTLPATTDPGKYNSIFRQIELQNPSYGDMANALQVGDVLMYNTCEDVAALCPLDTPYQVHLDTITVRNTTSSTLTLSFRGVEATFADTGYYVLGKETGFFAYNNTLKVYATDLMPEETKQANFLYYYPDDTSYCRTGLKVLQVANFIRTNYTINTANKLYRIYKMGLGKTKSYNLASGTVLDTNFTYTRSASISCGNGPTPYTLSVSGKNMQESVKIYPNPASDQLYVELNDAQEATISVISITGQVIMNKPVNSRTTQLDISQLSPGVYTVSIRSKDGTAYTKLVKSE